MKVNAHLVQDITSVLKILFDPLISFVSASHAALRSLFYLIYVQILCQMKNLYC